jgi:hypothetical protein
LGKEWGRGRVGEWGNGRAGEWRSGRVGEEGREIIKNHRVFLYYTHVDYFLIK